MPITDNNGSFYYPISCNVDDGGITTVEANSGTTYIYLTANDYILFGQSLENYQQLDSNTGTFYYLPPTGKAQRF